MVMSKRISALLVLVLVAAAPAGVAHAATKKPVKKTRTVAFAYRGSCAVTITPPGGPVGQGLPEDNCSTVGGGTTITATKTERYVAVSAVDATGQPVGIQVFEQGQYAEVTDACGAASKITVHPQTAYNFYLEPLVSTTCTGVLPTSGNLTVTFSNLP
jgi:hypothetical protein